MLFRSKTYRVKQELLIKIVSIPRTTKNTKTHLDLRAQRKRKKSPGVGEENSESMFFEKKTEKKANGFFASSISNTSAT